MTFFKNLFKRNAGNASQPPVPTPLPGAVPPDCIVPPELARVSSRLLTRAEAGDGCTEMANVAHRLHALLADIDDGPCLFPGFDKAIADAIVHIPFYCDIADGDFDQVNQYVDAIGEAIAVRQLTEETCDKLGPTIECHYHRMLLISLQARLEKINRDIAEKQAYRERILALPPEEQASHQATLASVHGYLQVAARQQAVIKSHIDLCRSAFMNAKHLLAYDGPLPPSDPQERLAEISATIQSLNEALD